MTTPIGQTHDPTYDTSSRWNSSCYRSRRPMVLCNIVSIPHRNDEAASVGGIFISYY